jgi:hypothetical protein
MTEPTLDEDWTQAIRTMARYERVADAARPSAAVAMTAMPPAPVTPGMVLIKAIKVTAIVRAEDALAIVAASGPVPITVRTETGATYTAALNPKTVRKVQAMIMLAGPANVVTVIQGKLAGTTIIECGITAQLKTPKPAGDPR